MLGSSPPSELVGTAGREKIRPASRQYNKASMWVRFAFALVLAVAVAANASVVVVAPCRDGTVFTDPKLATVVYLKNCIAKSLQLVSIGSGDITMAENRNCAGRSKQSPPVAPNPTESKIPLDQCIQVSGENVMAILFPGKPSAAEYEANSTSY